MAFVNPPSWQPNVSTTKFSLPQLPGTVPSTPFVQEEDDGWWGGIQQAGAYVALAFSLAASTLSANTAVQFQAQHQDEISRGPVVEEVYSYQDYKSLPVLNTDYPAYIAPHQDEISRGPVVDEVYDWKASATIDTVFLQSSWFDANELVQQAAVFVPIEDYWFMPSAPPAEIYQMLPYFSGAEEWVQFVPPPPTTQNYVNTGAHNYISQEIGEGIKF